MDAIAEWSAAQLRVTELLSGLDEQQTSIAVPACPAWTVRDLLSHMVGLGADVLAGDEPDDHNDTWTQRQVEQRRGRSTADLLAEWAELADDLRAWMAANSARPLGDVVIHEQDLRGALGVSGAQDTEGLHALRDRMVDGFGASLAGLPTITLQGSTWTWSSGPGADDADVVLQASDFDLTRAVMSRRSAAQLRSWTVRGDVTPFLDAFATLGPLPSADLTE